MAHPFGRLQRATFYLACAGVGVLTLALGAAIPVMSIGDKMEHVIAYVVLGLLGAATSQRGSLRVILGLAAFGIALEFLQTFSPGRSPDAIDALANIVGACIGAGAAIMLRRMTLIAIDKVGHGTTRCRACAAGREPRAHLAAEWQDLLHHR